MSVEEPSDRSLSRLLSVPPPRSPALLRLDSLHTHIHSIMSSANDISIMSSYSPTVCISSTAQAGQSAHTHIHSIMSSANDISIMSSYSLRYSLHLQHCSGLRACAHARAHTHTSHTHNVIILMLFNSFHSKRNLLSQHGSGWTVYTQRERERERV